MTSDALRKHLKGSPRGEEHWKESARRTHAATSRVLFAGWTVAEDSHDEPESTGGFGRHLKGRDPWDPACRTSWSEDSVLPRTGTCNSWKLKQTLRFVDSGTNSRNMFFSQGHGE